MVRFSALALVLCMLGGSAGLANAAAPDNSAVMAPINAVVAGANAYDGAAMSAGYTADATVLDEFPPFIWKGPGVGSAWVASLKAFSTAMKMTNFKATAGKPAAVHPDPKSGMTYVSLPVTLKYMYQGKPQTEKGMWSFWVVKSGAAMKIKASAWGTISDTSAP